MIGLKERILLYSHLIVGPLEIWILIITRPHQNWNWKQKLTNYKPNMGNVLNASWSFKKNH